MESPTNRIKEVLIEKGIKQTWLAEKLGKSFTIVNSYVCNRRQPSLELLFQIAEILQVNPKELINTPQMSNFIMVEHKKSIRFFNDREVRAVWDEEHSKWWFSVLDIIAAINEQDDYQKTRNYWKYLKTKLRKENSQLVSATNQLTIFFS